MVWSLMILPSIFAVDAVLRAFAQTRFLLVMNLMRLAMVVAPDRLVPLALRHDRRGAGDPASAPCVVKASAIVRIAGLMHVGLRDALPWSRLARHRRDAGVPLAPCVGRHAMIVVGADRGAAALSGAVYGSAYAAIWYVRHVHLERSRRASLLESVTDR